MQQKLIQIAGITWTLVCAAIIVWIYATEPRSFTEVTTNTRVAAGIYEVNQEKFNNGLELFRRDQFHAARDVWASADPAQQEEFRSEEHTSELQSHVNLVCRLLLEKKKLSELITADVIAARTS